MKTLKNILILIKILALVLVGYLTFLISSPFYILGFIWSLIVFGFLRGMEGFTNFTKSLVAGIDLQLEEEKQKNQ